MLRNIKRQKWKLFTIEGLYYQSSLRACPGRRDLGNGVELHLSSSLRSPLSASYWPNLIGNRRTRSLGNSFCRGQPAGEQSWADNMKNNQYIWKTKSLIWPAGPCRIWHLPPSSSLSLVTLLHFTELQPHLEFALSRRYYAAPGSVSLRMLFPLSNKFWPDSPLR